MERLLADAEKLTGVHYDISSYADVTEAIHAIQVEMNVAGKTAEEAASTIEGSVNAMKGAWQNWLTGLADPNADMSALTEQLVGAITTAAKNVVPRLAIIVSEVISALPGLMGEIAAELPGIIADTIGAVLGEEAGATALEAINGAVEAIQPLYDAISNVGEMASTAITTVMALAEELLPQMQPLFDVLSAAADVLMTYIVPFVFELVGSGLVVFIESVVGVVMALIAAAGELVAFVTTAPAQIVSFFSSLQASITAVFTSAAETVKGVWNGVVSFFAGIPDQIVGFFSGIGSRILSFFQGLRFPTLHLVGSLNPADWVTQGLPSIEWYARGGIFNAPTIAGIGEAGPEAVVPLSPSGLAPLVDAIDAGDRGRVTNVYIDGAKVNADEDIENAFYAFMRELSRIGAMQGVGA